MAAPGTPGYKRAILAGLGAPDTPQNEQFLSAWQRAEGGGATNNPFNTTQPGYGATGSYNSVGVRNYGTPQGGIAATVATLKNGRYGNILAALKQGTSARAAAQALANSPWGTGSLVLKILGGGSGAATSPPPVRTLPGVPGQGPPGQPLPLLPGQRAPVNLLGALGGAASSGDYSGFYAKLGQALQQRPGLPTGMPQRPIAPTLIPSKPPKAGSPVADLTSEGGQHPTLGLAGYPAHDFFAPSGSPAVAPVTGKVVRLSGHDPKAGPTEGPHGPLGWSVYIQGTDGHEYYLTHMGSRNVKVGETVKAGQPIGTVADYAKYGTPSHIHMGVR